MRNPQPLPIRLTGHNAFVVLFCPCGAQIELFNGEMGHCKNPQCMDFNRLWSVSVSVNDVQPSQLKATA